MSAFCREKNNKISNSHHKSRGTAWGHWLCGNNNKHTQTNKQNKHISTLKTKNPYEGGEVLRLSAYIIYCNILLGRSKLKTLKGDIYNRKWSSQAQTTNLIHSLTLTQCRSQAIMHTQLVPTLQRLSLPLMADLLLKTPQPNLSQTVHSGEDKPPHS